ncbi:unnamed protein product [Chironomus riparius]|uniref:SCP2 domain-containing protein n=1 Tax=Chironomus riparius TaxID=315576 RepID=A0A9N9RNT7_9DIPT|nr:unnamed protein product [Chironomus riparius]
MSLRSEAESFETIREKLQAIDTSNKDLAHIFKIRITNGGEVVKIMMLDAVNIKFYEGDEEAECTITLEDDLLANIVAKKTSAVEALKEELITAEGNLELLIILNDQL